MIGLRDLCVALLAGGVGAGGAVVAVQPPAQPKGATVKENMTVRPARRATGKPALPVRPAPASVAIPDCPLPALPSPDIGPFFDALPPLAAGAHPIPAPGAPYPAGPWGGGGALPPAPPPITPPAVPEPAGWAMLLAGFGLIGVGLRKRRPA